MPPLSRAVLIPQHGRDVKTYGVNYNKIHTMKSTLICLIVFIFHFCCVLAELEFYPDFRRPEPILKWENEQSAEEYALEQFTSYLQEQQRRLALQREPEPDFTYSVPVRPVDDTPEFAVAPPDPRYYQNSPEDDEEETRDNNLETLDPQTNQINQLNQEQPSYQHLRSSQSHEQFYRPQSISDDYQDESSQTNLNEQPQQDDKQQFEDNRVLLKTRTEQHQPESAHKLMESDLLLAGGGYKHLDRAVDITPVHAPLQDDTAGVYIIAVVAGISAATTVALIAFGIGWYNLQKNVKNATDVEYPAYGVTGPNKDVSPTGDRRLAQSAQMYHYQHQKQQIIAMESRAAATVRHGSMSEAESDEENEEGDYTVYECPGLAPAGEMEVKNPLFQDDPTPASQAAKDEESLPDQK